jgi:hypothetical protein
MCACFWAVIVMGPDLDWDWSLGSVVDRLGWAGVGLSRVGWTAAGLELVTREPFPCW